MDGWMMVDGWMDRWIYGQFFGKYIFLFIFSIHGYKKWGLQSALVLTRLTEAD